VLSSSLLGRADRRTRSMATTRRYGFHVEVARRLRS
jgi:hypothetical protein